MWKRKEVSSDKSICRMHKCKCPQCSRETEFILKCILFLFWDMQYTLKLTINKLYSYFHNIWVSRRGTFVHDPKWKKSQNVKKKHHRVTGRLFPANQKSKWIKLTHNMICYRHTVVMVFFLHRNEKKYIYIIFVIELSTENSDLVWTSLYIVHWITSKFTFVDDNASTLYANDDAKFQVLATLVQKLNYCTLNSDE